MILFPSSVADSHFDFTSNLVINFEYIVRLDILNYKDLNRNKNTWPCLTVKGLDPSRLYLSFFHFLHAWRSLHNLKILNVRIILHTNVQIHNLWLSKHDIFFPLSRTLLYQFPKIQSFKNIEEYICNSEVVLERNGWSQHQ